jgi:hypothetical protein
MRTTLTVVITIVLSSFAYSQVGINTTEPIASLDVTAKNHDGSTAEGIIPPRLTGEQLKAADTKYSILHAGTIVFVTAPVVSITEKTRNVNDQGLYYFDGSKWQKMMLGDERTLNSKNVGDIKTSVKTSDHNGWYLLNGRNVTTLPAEAQYGAESLGFSDRLPDATDRVLKGKTSNEILGSVGGDNSLGLTQANLPNINLSGTINGTALNAGSHTHNAAEGGFLLGGTTLNSNGTGSYEDSATATAWGGIGLMPNTSPSGTHSHTVTGTATVSTGGTGKSLDNRSAYLVVNTFIYLGE